MPDKATASKHRNSKVGEVVSRAGDKTIVVEVTRRVQHPLYKRFVNKAKKFYAHDEKNECQIGDSVRIVESRPLSRLKRWRLKQIIHRKAVIAAENQQAESTPLPEEVGS